MSNFDSNIIKNPEIFEQNRLAAHSDHVCYKNELEKIKGKSSLRYDMNGLWKFAYAKNQSLAPCGFEAADYDCKGWDEIRVPAHIQMEGYDVPIYTNTTYPWEADESIKPGEVPEIFNPVASYVKYFTIPENMKNKRVCISFQGVESGFALWLNGHYVGYSEDTFDPSDFELTDYIIEGENKLAVRVWKWTSSSWCEDQDFYRFSGIFRDVFLYAVPCAHVEDLSVVPTLNDTFDEGTLSVSIKADGDGIASVKLYELGDLSVEKYDRAKLLLEEFDIELRDKEICEGSCNVKNPLLWSAEKPNLYEVKIIVKDTHGNETEFISQLAGFRRFEMVDGLMKLNGKRIVFKGVNRHEFSSITGRVPNRDEVIKDIVTMKKNNINAIRTSHYPDDSMLYKLCDIYGIYMIAENNLESHGTWEAYNKGYVDLDFVVPKDKTVPTHAIRGIKIIRQSLSGHAAMSRLAARPYMRCHSFSDSLISIVWFIMREYLAIEAIMTQATWKARCILRLQALKNSWQSILRNRLSAANIHMQWEIPAVLCTNIQSLQTASLDIRADLSGIILTSQSTKRTDTASGSSHMAEISATGLQMEISAETASVMAERERLLQRCRR